MTAPVIVTRIGKGAPLAFAEVDANFTNLRDAITGLNYTDITGDLTIGLDNVAAISAGVIVNADINASAGIVDTKLAAISTANKVALSALDIDGATDIGAALADGDLFAVDDGGGGTNRKAAASRVSAYVFDKVSGDVTISSTGTCAIGAGVIVDADINASAAISGSKIQAGSTSAAGVLQLTDATNSTSTTTAATANSVKGAYDLAAAAIPKAGGAFTGDVTLNGQSDLRFADSDSSHYVGFQAPTTIGANVLWTLPSTDGSSGQALTTNGSGTLSWSSPSGGGDVVLSANNAFTGANSFTNANGQTFRTAAGRDGLLLRGRAGGSGSYTVELVPAALSASRTLTAPNVSGTLITTGDSGTITGGMLSSSIAIATSGAIRTTSTLAVGRDSPEANTILDVKGTYASNVVAVAASSIDCSAGNYFTKTVAGDTTFTFDNVAGSRAVAFSLEITHTSGTITWPASVKWPGDTAPTLTTGKTHLFVFVSDDGGSRWRGTSLVNYTN